MKARVLLALALVAAAPLQAQRIAEISVAPPLLRLRPGAQVHVLATAYDRAGLPVDARLTWTSSNINVATVDSLGRVYAIAPGIAIITAASDTAGARRRYGRSTVFVSTTQWGPGPKTIVVGDTIPPEECNDPNFALRNPGRACWDVRPRQRSSTTLTAPASCEGHVIPVVYQVRVAPDGRVLERQRLGRPGCQDYEQRAAELLEQVCCTPAWRNGHAVTAWTIVTIRPPHEGRVYVFPAPPVPGVPQALPPAPPDKPSPRP